MKTKLAAIVLSVTSVSGFSQSFYGTVTDYDTGRIRSVISGSVEHPDITRPIQKNIEAYRRMNAELEASIANMRAQAEMERQTHELREQTELLRKIANE